jgi:proteasome lid subunit RPN8/RPN11
MLEIPRLVWINLILNLRARGRRRRESGAFLLAQAGSNKITSFICYDDLDPNCLNRGYIDFDGSGFVPLWKHCAAENCRVIADVHTHPGDWVGQSETDLAHPMLPVEGHVALILPNYAHCSLFSFKGIGTYAYLGGDQWRTFKRPKMALKLTLL